MVAQFVLDRNDTTAKDSQSNIRRLLFLRTSGRKWCLMAGEHAECEYHAWDSAFLLQLRRNLESADCDKRDCKGRD